MNHYSEAINWIHGREKFKIKPGLKRMEWMMEQLGHPEEKLKVIHIAGTNGKGSTLSFLRSLLNGQGFRVGTFTSPYITRFNERISIDGDMIPDESLTELVAEIKPLVEALGHTELGEPTEFEVITAISLLYFSKSSLDFVIMETGLGGRLDSTNVVKPILTIITNIGKDHMNILGDTYEKIAYEKAGIIKKGVPLISGVRHNDALSVIKDKANEHGAKQWFLGEHFTCKHLTSEPDGERFEFNGPSFRATQLKTGLIGLHQVENAALAIQAIEVLRYSVKTINPDFYQKSILHTKWPARFEIVQKHPTVILDGAHNEEGMQALVTTLKQHYPSSIITVLYAAVEDKPIQSMLTLLQQVADRVIFTTFDFPKAMSTAALVEESPFHNPMVIDEEQEALKVALATTKKDELLVITGSLYFISNLRKNFEPKELM